jgi:hypothetical protein
MQGRRQCLGGGLASTRQIVTSQIDENELLPSDCRFRIDRSMLIQGDVSGAEEGKILIENLQRRDVKLRVKEAPK